MTMESINRKKLILRTVVLILTFGLAFYDTGLIKRILAFDTLIFKVYQIIWFFLFLEMLQVFIPSLNNYVSCGKLFAKHFKASPVNHDHQVIHHHIRKNNMGAIKSGAFWLLLLSVIGLLYYLEVLSDIGLHLLVVFFYFADQFCINIWCIFRSWIIKNKCCNTCRIYNWGHFMIFSPWIFIPSFWTYSLLTMSLIILIQWEYMHYRHPYRFIELTNLNLQCASCLAGKCSYIQ